MAAIRDGGLGTCCLFTPLLGAVSIEGYRCDEVYIFFPDDVCLGSALWMDGLVWTLVSFVRGGTCDNSFIDGTFNEAL